MCWLWRMMELRCFPPSEPLYSLHSHPPPSLHPTTSHSTRSGWCVLAGWVLPLARISPPHPFPLPHQGSRVVEGICTAHVPVVLVVGAAAGPQTSPVTGYHPRRCSSGLVPARGVWRGAASIWPDVVEGGWKEEGCRLACHGSGPEPFLGSDFPQLLHRASHAAFIPLSGLRARFRPLPTAAGLIRGRGVSCYPCLGEGSIDRADINHCCIGRLLDTTRLNITPILPSPAQARPH